MKQIHILLITLLACLSCEQSVVEPATTTTGYLSISKVQLFSDGEPISAETRAIPAELSIQILQGDQLIQELVAPIPEEPIQLPSGSYQLRVYTEAPSEPTESLDKGVPIYEGLSSFEIKENELTLIEATATQINIAIRVVVTDSLILNNFPFYTTTIRSETRTVTIEQGESTPCYFAVPENRKLTYTMTLINSDEESFTTEPKIVEVAERTQYTLSPVLE